MVEIRERGERLKIECRMMKGSNDGPRNSETAAKAEKTRTPRARRRTNYLPGKVGVLGNTCSSCRFLLVVPVLPVEGFDRKESQNPGTWTWYPFAAFSSGAQYEYRMGARYRGAGCQRLTGLKGQARGQC